MQWLVWRSGSGVGQVELRRTRSVLRLVTFGGIYPGHLGPLSLVIPPWVMAMVSATAGDETASSA